MAMHPHPPKPLDVARQQQQQQQMPPQEHPMLTLMRDIGNELHITVSQVHDGGVICMQNERGHRRFAVKYVLPVNSSSSAAVCRDKAATSDVLKHEGIPCVQHMFFMSPLAGDWVPVKGSWPSIHAFGQSCFSIGVEVVCKPKGGSAGKGVERAKNPRELEQAVTRILKTHRDLVLCRFEKIVREYRVVVYNNRVEAVLNKMLPQVVGNGRDSEAELVQRYLSAMEESQRQLLAKDNIALLFSTAIPAEGQVLTLHWRHNGPGALTSIAYDASNVDAGLELPANDFRTVSDLALRAAKALDICFSSVDIVQVDGDAGAPVFKVLEVNSATMIDSAMDTQPERSRQMEKRIYTKIVRDLFAGSSIRFETPTTLQNLDFEVLPPSEQSTFRLASVIKTIAEEKSWGCSNHSQGWISVLSHKDRVGLVYGNVFPLNSSTGAKICTNKPVCSSILKLHGIPQVRHFLASLPVDGLLAKSHGGDAREKARAFAQWHDFKVVCKPAKGTCGANVERVTSAAHLESILCTTRAPLAICKFYKIEAEYRFIVLDGEVELFYEKVPPFVIGDGVRTVCQLASRLIEQMNPKSRDGFLRNVKAEQLVLTDVLAKGERHFLHWKHNLGQGARCVLLGGKSSGIAPSDIPESHKTMIELAHAAMAALGLRFASVDIVEIAGDTSKKYRVLEVNSGVMMDSMIEQCEKGKQIAMTIYHKALTHYLTAMS